MTDYILANYWVFMFLFFYLIAVAGLMVLELCRALIVRGNVRAEQRRNGERR